MKKLMFFLMVLLSSITFSQSTSRDQVSDDGPKPQDFYMLCFEFKNFQVTPDNMSILEGLDLKSLMNMKNENQDVEIYLENIQKTIVIYSKNKSEELMEKNYTHNPYFKPILSQ